MEFEHQLLGRIGAVADEYRTALTEAGVEMEVQAISSALPPDDRELRVDFLRKGELFDIIEFHLYRHGRPVASVIELDQWFRSEITKLLSKAGHAS